MKNSIGVDALVDEVRAMPGVKTFQAHVDGDTLVLDMIEVGREARGSGVGIDVMRRFVAFADRNGLRAGLSPDVKNTERGTTSRSRLVAFYKRFGFRENSGRSRDFSTSLGMLREPARRDNPSGCQCESCRIVGQVPEERRDNPFGEPRSLYHAPGMPIAGLGRRDNPLCDVEKLAEKVATIGAATGRLRDSTAAFRSPEGQADAVNVGRWSTSWRMALGSLRAHHEVLRDRMNASSVFHAVLQQYHLPTKLRKVIEEGAKFYARERALTPRSPASTKEMIEDVIGYHAALVQAMAEGTPSDVCGVEAGRFLQAGPFRLVNTGGFSEEVMQLVKGIVVEASERLNAIGLDCLLYGDVYVSNQISGKDVAAFYYGKSDEFFIRADKKILAHREHVVRTVAHELAHRFDRMFLRDAGGAVPPELWAIYRAVEKAEAGCEPAPGERFSIRGEEFEVKGWRMGVRATGAVAIQKLSEPEGLLRSVPLGSYCSYTKRGFVSDYAREGAGGPGSKPEENFAEMIAEDAMGRLPDWQAELLIPVMAKGIAKADERKSARKDNPVYRTSVNHGHSHTVEIPSARRDNNPVSKRTLDREEDEQGSLPGDDARQAKKDMIASVKKAEKAFGVVVPDALLGCGDNGCVLPLTSGDALKITSSQREVELVRAIMELPTAEARGFVRVIAGPIQVPFGWAYVREQLDTPYPRGSADRQFAAEQLQRLEWLGPGDPERVERVKALRSIPGWSAVADLIGALARRGHIVTDLTPFNVRLRQDGTVVAFDAELKA